MSKPGNAQKYSLSEALQRFSDEEAWDRFAALEKKCIDRGFVRDFLGAPDLNMLLDERNEDDRARLDLTSKREEALKAITIPFIKKLAAGTLISDGYHYPLTPDAQKHCIAPDMWNFLRPLFWNSGASGGGIKYEGISVWELSAVSPGDEIDSEPSEHAAENGDDRSGSTTTPTSVTRTAKERRGRKPGSGSYESDDLPLIEEMKGLVGGVKGMSPWAAANSVAGKAKGAGTPESKAKRLYKLFQSN